MTTLNPVLETVFLINRTHSTNGIATLSTSVFIGYNFRGSSIKQLGAPQTFHFILQQVPHSESKSYVPKDVGAFLKVPYISPILHAYGWHRPRFFAVLAINTAGESGRGPDWADVRRAPTAVGDSRHSFQLRLGGSGPRSSKGGGSARRLLCGWFLASSYRVQGRWRRRCGPGVTCRRGGYQLSMPGR